MSALAALDIRGICDDQLWYVAHPVHPTDDEVAAWTRRLASPISGDCVAPDLVPSRMAVLDNVTNAKAWLAWLVCAFPTITFIAPWIAALDGGDDDLDPAMRARGLRDCCRTVSRCDGMVHVGGRVSTGMLEEAYHARVVIDLTYLGRCPPTESLTSAVSSSRDGSERTDILDQPPPVHRPDLVPVWECIVQDFQVRYAASFASCIRKVSASRVEADMRERDRIGRERYGTPLTAHNGRDQLVDAYQEALDKAAYLRAAWLEGGHAPDSYYDEVRDLYYDELDSVMRIRTTIDSRSR